MVGFYGEDGLRETASPQKWKRGLSPRQGKRVR
jgi:hypothetical protein